MLDRLLTVGQVLVKGSATGDVERLRAAADREDRQAMGVRLRGDRELEAVELGLDGPELGVAALAVGRRVDVGPPERQTRRGAQQRPDRVELPAEDHDGQAAGGLDRLQVRQPERHLPARRLSLGRRRDLLGVAHLRRGHADQGPVFRRRFIATPRCPCRRRSVRS